MLLFVNDSKANDKYQYKSYEYDSVTQNILNKTNVINNVIIPNPIQPLIVDAPPARPAPLKMRPFNFQPNMEPLPQQGDDYQNPFVSAVRSDIPSTFIMNNIIVKKTTTTINSSDASTTYTSKATHSDVKLKSKHYLDFHK